MRTKTVAAKAAAGDTVACGVPTPTSPVVMTQDVRAAEAASTEAAQRVQQLRAALDGDGDEQPAQLDGDGGESDLDLSADSDDSAEAVVVSSRPNARNAKRARKERKKKEENKRSRGTKKQVDDEEGDEEGDEDTVGQPAIDAIDAGRMTVDASTIPPALQWEVGASGIASTQLRSFTEEVASSTGTNQVCSSPVSCLRLWRLLCVCV